MARRLTYDEVKYFIEVESDSGCKLISEEYANAKSDLAISCSCGTEFHKRYDRLQDLNNIKCGDCLGRRIIWDINKVKEYISLNSGGKCTLVSEEFKTTKINLAFKCECGEQFERTFHNLKGKKLYLCGKCLGREECTLETVKEYIENVSGSGCKLISRVYTNSSHKLKFKCVCEETFERSFTKFKHDNQRVCLSCSLKISKAEEYILKYFNHDGIEYRYDKNYKNLKGLGGGFLRYDFLIGKERLFIEYDGEDHFYPVDRAGKGEEWANNNHKYRIQNDNIKNQYCIDNSIPLLRIPYWEFNNIEVILESALMHFNIIKKTDAYDVSRFEEWLVDENWSHNEYLSKCPKNQKESVKHIN